MYVVIADIPGVPKDRVSVQVKDNKIMIEGKRKKKVVSDEDVYLIAGRRNGFFKKMIEMPIDADSQQMAAKIEDGMLILTIPRVKTVDGATYVSIHLPVCFNKHAVKWTVETVYFFLESFSLIAFRAACSSFCLALKALSSYD